MDPSMPQTPPQPGGPVEVSDLLSKLKQYGAQLHVPLDMSLAGTKINWSSLLDSTLDAQRLKAESEARQDFDRRKLELNQQLQLERADKARLQQSVSDWERWANQVNVERRARDDEIQRLRSQNGELGAKLSVLDRYEKKMQSEMAGMRQTESNREMFNTLGKILRG